MIPYDLSNPFQSEPTLRFNEVFDLAKETDFFMDLLQKQPSNSDFLKSFPSELEQYYQERENDRDGIVEEKKSISIKDEINMSERVQVIYNRLLGKTTLQKRQQFRIDILLRSLDPDESITSIAKDLKTTRKTVRYWIARFVNYSVYLELPSVKALKAGHFTKLLLFIIKDAPRSGRPVDFSPEIILQIFFIACEDPMNSGRPISHWSAREIADEMIKRGIVDTISERQVKRFLQQAELKPHLSRYWCNSPEKRGPEFDNRVKMICDLYLNVSDYAKQNIRIISMDEKTGIQAIGRIAPTKRMKPGRIEQCEHNYSRKGTSCLIAGLEVRTGKIVEPFINLTRKEEDWVEAIKKIVATDPCAKYIFIIDQLNTHKSASLVEYVTKFCNIKDDLGVKGKEGILKNMKTRQKYLEIRDHQISFFYTPKHTSWLNQIEIWFSILSRKLLKRGNFSSIEQLESEILQFINYYNFTMAKPFKWNYKGRPLTR